MPAWIWVVGWPAVGHDQEKRTESGMLIEALDLFCQMPVVSMVSVPSMKTLAWPGSQHCSPMVPMRAMPRPLKAMDAGIIAVTMSWLVLTAPFHAPARGTPVGSIAAAANMSAKPPLV